MPRAFFLDYHVHAEWVMREGDIVRLAYSWRGQIFLSNREHFRHKSLTFSLLSAIMFEIHLRSCFAAVFGEYRSAYGYPFSRLGARATSRYSRRRAPDS
jgi:hypothetical protein